MSVGHPVSGEQLPPAQFGGDRGSSQHLAVMIMIIFIIIIVIIVAIIVIEEIQPPQTCAYCHTGTLLIKKGEGLAVSVKNDKEKREHGHGRPESPRQLRSDNL